MNERQQTSTRALTATVLDRLIESLRSRNAPLDGQERPVAILWTDPKAEWRGLLDLLLSRVKELLVLGDYHPEARSGPAIWLRCLVDGAFDEPKLPGNRAPILCLPGVARQQLRAGAECPDALKPLVELMFRGAIWVQPNGSDWTVSAFLTSPKALGLDVARDHATLEALLRALPEVALATPEQLEGKRLEADDFDRMLAGDVVRDLLRWMGDPEGTRARLGSSGWGAFANRCRDELGFDPDRQSDVEAGEQLGRGEGPWQTVWERFAEAPKSYEGIAELLRRSRPAGELPFARDRWPDLNDEDEATVRKVLTGLPALSHAEACDAVARLERENGPRRGWVWARMGLAPMAAVLEPLARLAEGVSKSLGGTTPDDVAAAYLDRGWQADAAAWEAVAIVSPGDEVRVGQAVRQLLAPWLDESARAFQSAVERSPLPTRDRLPLVEADDDVCILFVDGLRVDLGQRLADRLEGRGCRASVGHRWAALPTVTATGKPAVTPVAGEITADELGDDFTPHFDSTKKPVTAQSLREAIAQQGYQILGTEDAEAPRAHPARGWLETGEIDSLGHKLQATLARQLPEQLDRVAGRILALLESGWRAVRVVTDHGWLLLPGGLPKVDLPKHLTATRWSRCAVVAGDSSPSVGRAPWTWNASQRFATAPGIACFNRSDEYSHGGLSIQECLIPDIRVENAAEANAVASIRSITWRRLRCLVEVASRGGRVVADLRLERPSGPSVAASTKAVEEDGSVSLVLESDEYEASPLVLVLLSEDGRILTHQATRVGADR